MVIHLPPTTSTSHCCHHHHPPTISNIADLHSTISDPPLFTNHFHRCRSTLYHRQSTLYYLQSTLHRHRCIVIAANLVISIILVIYHVSGDLKCFRSTPISNVLDLHQSSCLHGEINFNWLKATMILHISSLSISFITSLFLSNQLCCKIKI